MGNIIHVQQGEWQSIESSTRPVLVDFWAEWCAPCRMMAPAFEKLAENYGGAMTFAKVDVDELPEVAGQYGIRSIPTLLLLRGGEVLEELVGARPYEHLARVLDRYVMAAEGSRPGEARCAN